MNSFQSAIYGKGGATPNGWHGWDLNAESSFHWGTGDSTLFGDIGAVEIGKIQKSMNSIGRRPTIPSRFNKPGLLLTAIAAGTAGTVTGDGSPSSFAIGAVAGVGGGYLAEAGGKLAHSRLQTMAKSGVEMSTRMNKAVNLGRMMTGKSGRAALFASGALMAGGMFSSMFADNRPSYRSGFNANRGSR